MDMRIVTGIGALALVGILFYAGVFSPFLSDSTDGPPIRPPPPPIDPPIVPPREDFPPIPDDVTYAFDAKFEPPDERSSNQFKSLIC